MRICQHFGLYGQIVNFFHKFSLFRIATILVKAFLSSGSFDVKALRAFRVLRPLRLVSGVPSKCSWNVAYRRQLELTPRAVFMIVTKFWERWPYRRSRQLIATCRADVGRLSKQAGKWAKLPARVSKKMARSEEGVSKKRSRRGRELQLLTIFCSFHLLLKMNACYAG